MKDFVRVHTLIKERNKVAFIRFNFFLVFSTPLMFYLVRKMSETMLISEVSGCYREKIPARLTFRLKS